MDFGPDIVDQAAEWARRGIEHLEFILIEGDWATAILYVAIFLVILFIILVILANAWEMFLSRMPYLSTHPRGLPSSRNYMVKIAGSEPYEFTWKYPYLMVGGSRYRFDKYEIDKDDPLQYLTANLTHYQFVRKPESIKS